jgi:hypothetical protein
MAIENRAANLQTIYNTLVVLFKFPVCSSQFAQSIGNDSMIILPFAN